MRFIKRILSMLFPRETGKLAEPVKPPRKHPSDVKNGEHIYIEWSKIKGGLGHVLCVNNDPETESMLLEVNWRNAKDPDLKTERFIAKYCDSRLKNFHLLNSITIPDKDDDDSDDDSDETELESLQNELDDAIKNEDYEKAKNIKSKIDKLKGNEQS